LAGSDREDAQDAADRIFPDGRLSAAALLGAARIDGEGFALSSRHGIARFDASNAGEIETALGASLTGVLDADFEVAQRSVRSLDANRAQATVTLANVATGRISVPLRLSLERDGAEGPWQLTELHVMR
jgi:hypothetical protein